MRAIAVDKYIHNIKDRFLNCYPQLIPNPDKEKNLCCNIEFYNFDIHCNDFLSFFDKEATNIDYIVVSLTDDEINKQLALDILTHYKRKGLLLEDANEEPNGKPLGIFVGKEIYYSGDGSYPNSQPLNNITITGTFSAASSGV